MGSTIYTDELNILQDLYDTESPPEVLQPNSVISVRVNPSGEFYFVSLYSERRFCQPSPLF
jgi:hypothetical protein